MDDSDTRRGTPVLSDAWVQAHTPTRDAGAPAQSIMDRKKRRSWFTGQVTPVKTAPSGTQKRLESHEEEVATIQITHFTKKVILSFDDVRLDSTKVMTLRLDNPHDYPQEVELEKFPFQKGFSVPETVWEVEANQSLDVPVSWTPTEEKNVRELVTFKCEGIFRLQLIVLGTVKVPKKKKNVNRRSTFTARKGQTIQSRRSVAVTNPRRETFVQRKSPRSQAFGGKENKLPVVGKKVDSPRTRKARARSVGTVLEKVLTPRQTLPQGKVDRVMVGDKVCMFSPQLTAKAMMEITGQSPFADGKMKASPRKETLTLCDGMSPLLTSTGNQDNLRKVALDIGPMRRLSKEQTSTVTKKSPSTSRLSDEDGVEPHHLEFLDDGAAEISQITPASSVFEPLEHSFPARLSSTRIDDIVYPAAPAHAPFFLGEEAEKLEKDEQEKSPSIEDDSLEADKLQTFELFSEAKSEQDDVGQIPDEVQNVKDTEGIEKQEIAQSAQLCDDIKDSCNENAVEVERSSKEDTQKMVSHEENSAEEMKNFNTMVDSLPQQSTESFTALLETNGSKHLEMSKPSDLESCSDDIDCHAAPRPVQDAKSWRISLGGSGSSKSLKDAPRVQKPKLEGSMKVTLGSSKRSPGTRPAAGPKRPNSRASSRPSSQASISRPAGPSPKDFTIHKSAVTSRLNRKRLSDPIYDQAAPKKSRPSPEHKASTRESLRPKKAVVTASLASSRQVNRTVALRKAAATGKAVPAKAPVSSKPKGKPKAPKAVKGVPMAKLQLLKPVHSALPRHPLPFAAKNVFYDERWMEKQERAFTCWLNYVLTPDIDTPKDPNKHVKIDAHLLCLEGASKVGPAPSREDLSLRAYTARRRLNRLRRGACLVFQSEPVIRVMQKLEAEVEKGRIVIRSDKMLHADLGIKQELLNLILCYNPLWLRIGLETIYGELLPIQDNSDIYGMSRFIVTRLLGNPDIAASHAHPTVPNLFGPGYQASLAEFTLKKFLMLVFFLDRAKLTRLIDHDPCLFCKEAQVKSSRDLLLEFSRRYLKGEGDITRHLGFLGYSVMHVQKPLDEFDFAVNKLAVDLRCGVRLSRVVELLTQNWSLSKELRVPAISRLQKIHNVEVAFKTLKDRGIDVEGGGLNERVIVDGHREKTLQLLWRIIFHYQVAVMLNEEYLREEIAFLTKNRKLREKLDALKKGGNNAPSHPSLDAPHLYFKSPQLMLLMDWCKAVCLFYDLQIENFTVSFCDGRALCLLVHHYHPSLLPFGKINQETSLMQFQREEREDVSPDSSFDGTWSHTFSPSIGKETNQDKLLANERQNFKHLYEAVNELGGVPMMVKSTDMSNTIPDEKVVITYVSYLCARLLDLRKETRAARTIQLAWRAHHLKKEEKMRMVREKAASTIQSLVRAFLLKRRNKRIGGAVLTIQTAIRGYLAKQTVKRLRCELAIKKQSQAGTLIQAAVKGFLVRQTISRQRAAALVIQRFARGYMARLRVFKMQTAASTIQGWYRSQREMKAARQRFVQLKRAAVNIQAAWRGIMVRRLVKQMRAVITIQCVWRGYLVRKTYLKQRSAVIILQANYRMHRAMRDFRNLRSAVVKMQALYRSKVAGEMQRAKYCTLRDATIVLQKMWRGWLGRREACKVRSAVTIQAAFRGHLQRAFYLKQRSSAIVIQAVVRGCQTRRSYEQLRQATKVLQTRYRAVLLGRQVCREFNIARGAAITIQSAIRCFQQRKRFVQTRCSIILIQATVRAHIGQKKYRELQKAALVMQTRYRAVLLGRQVCREYNIARGAAITIQSTVRCYHQRKLFLETRRNIILIQAAVRGHIVQKKYSALQKAALVMQTRYRALAQGRKVCREYGITKGAAITLQAAWKGYVARREYLVKRSAAVKLQSLIRCRIARRRYSKLQEACVVLQRRYRAMCQMKNAVLTYNNTCKAVVTIQAVFRGFLQRKDYLQTRAAVITIQTSVRCYLARKDFIKMKSATIVLQRRYRALVIGRELQAEYHRLRAAVIHIQASNRCHVQRMCFVKQRSAAIAIQAEVRKRLARQRYLQLREATIAIQTRYRARMLMLQLAKSYKSKRSSAIVIQSVYRGHAQRKIFLRQKSAAVTIQAQVRGYLQHRRYMKVQQAVCVLQTRFRAWATGQACQEEYYLARGRIITLQALYRGYATRKMLRIQKAAATTIQANFRCFTARTRYLRLKQAVLILQTRLRAQILAREASQSFQKTRAGIIAIQSLYRGYAQRKELARQHRAATLIQASYKRYHGRSRFLQLKNAAVVLQTHFRSLQLGREVSREYNIKRGAAITLQAAFRGCRQRKTLAKERRAAIIIQSAFRAYQAGTAYASLRSTAIVVQRRFRANLLRKRICSEYNVMRGAAITLQAAYRGHLQRKALAWQHLAATQIQTHFRGYVQRKWYCSVIRAVAILQKRFRAQMLAQAVRNDYLTMRKAAVTLQSAYRGHLQRKDLSRQHQSATRIQATFRGHITKKWYCSVINAVVILQTRFRAQRLAQETMREYHVMRGAAITLQAAYRGHLQRKMLSQQNRSATKIQAVFRGFIARKRYQNICHAAKVLQMRFRALKLGREVQRTYRERVNAIVTLQAAFRGFVARRALQKQHEMATRIQASFRGYIQRRKYQRICNAVQTLQRHVRSLRFGRRIRNEYKLQRLSAIKIQAFYRCHSQRKSFLIMKRSAVMIQAMVRGYLGFILAQRYREERTAAAVSIQRQWRANAQRDQQVRCFNIQRGAAITIQAAARMYLVRKSIRKQHHAATCIQANYRCHRAVQSYRRTLQAVKVLQDHLRAHLLAKQVQEEYLNLKQAVITMQAVYRGLRVRQRISLEHTAATKIEATVRMFLARKHYRRQQLAAIVLQRRFRAQISCKEETLKYHLTRGACITIQASIRGFLTRRSLERSHQAATQIQSIYRAYKQRQEYNRTMAAIISIQTKVRAHLERKKAQKEFLAMKSAAIAVQSMYRGLMGRRLAARHRAARCIQSTFRMHLARQSFLKQRSAAIKLQAMSRMYLVKKSYKNVRSAVCTLQKHFRGYLEMKRTRGEFLQTKSAIVTIQSHFRCCIARRRYLKQRHAAICIQSYFRRVIQQRQYQAIRSAVLVIQRRYRATILARDTQHKYHMMRGAAITIQAAVRGYKCTCWYQTLRCSVMRMQAMVRGSMARRRYRMMARERDAAVCIQRHVRGYQARKHLEAQRQARLVELQAFANRIKAHLSIIRLQRAYRNFRLRRAFKQKMNAIIAIQSWMRAKLQRLRFRKIKQAVVVLQRGARRYLVKKNAAATKLQSVARVWLAKRQVQKMHSAALQMQALWRGYCVRKSIKSKKVREARARCQRANRNVTEEKKLRNRTATALDYLLHYKSMHRIMETLMNLEVVSRLSAVCCERLVEAGAVPVLYALIRGCNRSIPCMEMIEMIASIFLNITKHDSTLHAVLDVEDSVTTLIDLLQIYREKNAVIFCKTSVILAKLLQDSSQAKIIISVPKTKEKIASLHKLTSRKHAMDERRIKTKTLNASSSFIGTSFNVSSVGASFVAGTPRKQRKVLGTAGSEWNITDPMRAIDFLKRMSDRV